MRRTLHVVGTSHHYQFGTGATYGARTCSADDDFAFAKMLRDLAISSSATAIAEELNTGALEEVGSTASVPQRVAEELKLDHLFCEPDRAERRTLGILDENEIRVSAFPATLDEELVQQRAAQSWALREEEWLRRLGRLAAERIVFVCGANHISSFVPRLVESGFHVVVEHADWEG